MPKKNSTHKEENIILFPNLEKRLAEKGLEKLQEKNYAEAVSLLEQAIELEPFQSEINIGLALAYFDSGEVEKARHIAERMLKEGIGNYIEVMDLYLMLLVQMHEYQAVITAIEGLLEERNISAEKYEHFLRMLHFSRRMVDTVSSEQPSLTVHEEIPEELYLTQLHDPQEQMMLVGKLRHLNIIPYLSEISSYLQSTHGNPFFKTLLLQLLKEHQYEKTVEIQKFGKQGYFIPSALPELGENPYLETVYQLTSDQIEDDDPILYENIKNIIQRQSFLLFPFFLDMESYDPKTWATAYHVLASEYYGNFDSFRILAEKYQLNEERLRDAISYLKMIEENSSPNI
jgi:tetratricopeptide (TPR) repeat protein